MAITDLPMLSALRTKMQWHQERQRVLAENVSQCRHAEFQAARSGGPKFDSSGTGPVTGAMPSLTMARTSAGTFRRLVSATSFNSEQSRRLRDAAGGNAVSLEDEMMKVSANQMDYEAVTSLYSRSLGLLKTAIGKALSA